MKIINVDELSEYLGSGEDNHMIIHTSDVDYEIYPTIDNEYLDKVVVCTEDELSILESIELEVTASGTIATIPNTEMKVKVSPEHMVSYNKYSNAALINNLHSGKFYLYLLFSNVEPCNEQGLIETGVQLLGNYKTELEQEPIELEQDVNNEPIIDTDEPIIDEANSEYYGETIVDKISKEQDINAKINSMSKEWGDFDLNFNLEDEFLGNDNNQIKSLEIEPISNDTKEVNGIPTMSKEVEDKNVIEMVGTVEDGDDTLYAETSIEETIKSDPMTEHGEKLYADKVHPNKETGSTVDIVELSKEFELNENPISVDDVFNIVDIVPEDPLPTGIEDAGPINSEELINMGTNYKSISESLVRKHPQADGFIEMGEIIFEETNDISSIADIVSDDTSKNVKLRLEGIELELQESKANLLATKGIGNIGELLTEILKGISVLELDLLINNTGGK